MEKNELFSEKEKEAVAKKYKADMKLITLLKHRLDVFYSDYLLELEENRILRKHFSVTDKMYSKEIEPKYIKNRRFPEIFKKTKHPKQ